MKKGNCPNCKNDLDGYEPSMIEGYFITVSQIPRLQAYARDSQVAWFKDEALRRDHCPQCQHIFEPEVVLSVAALKLRERFVILKCIEQTHTPSKKQIIDATFAEFGLLWERWSNPVISKDIWVKVILRDLEEAGFIQKVKGNKDPEERWEVVG